MERDRKEKKGENKTTTQAKNKKKNSIVKTHKQNQQQNINMAKDQPQPVWVEKTQQHHTLTRGGENNNQTLNHQREAEALKQPDKQQPLGGGNTGKYIE